jgi:hypothetical protein
VALWSMSCNSWFFGIFTMTCFRWIHYYFCHFAFPFLVVVLQFPFSMVLHNVIFCWDFPHVVSFHLHFLQIQMVMPYHLIGLNIVARFFNDMFYVSSHPCHYAHVFIMVLHNNTFIFLKTTIVNDNEMCITLNYLQTIIFHDSAKYNTLIVYKP